MSLLHGRQSPRVSPAAVSAARTVTCCALVPFAHHALLSLQAVCHLSPAGQTALDNLSLQLPLLPAGGHAAAGPAGAAGATITAAAKAAASDNVRFGKLISSSSGVQPGSTAQPPP